MSEHEGIVTLNPVHFIVLEIKLVNNYKPIPIILGRAISSTANAVINCRNGLMNLSFGNLTLESFSICVDNLMKKIRMKMRLMSKMNGLNLV